MKLRYNYLSLLLYLCYNSNHTKKLANLITESEREYERHMVLYYLSKHFSLSVNIFKKEYFEQQ